MAEMAMFNVQRVVTSKVGRPELRFICSARRLIYLYICVKFSENVSDGINYGEDTNDGSADGWTFKVRAQKVKRRSACACKKSPYDVHYSSYSLYM